MPADANAGAAFQFHAPNGRADASALRIDDAEGSIWAAKVEYRGDKISGRNWITDLFVEQRKGSLVRFGAQLNCVCAPSDPGFDHSRPRVVRDIIDNLAAEADGEALSNSFEEVTERGVENFVSLIYNPTRRLPVVAISTDDDGGAQVDLERLAIRLSGSAHLRFLKVEPTFELSRAVGKRMSVFNGGIRIYMPGLDQESEDPFQHPLWLAPDSGWNPRAASQVASRILPLGFRDADGDARFWRIGLLRQVASRRVANEELGSEPERLKAENLALEAENAALKEASDSAESLMYEEATKLSSAQAEVARLIEENSNLRERMRTVGSRDRNPLAKITPDDLYGLFEQSPKLDSSLRIIASLFPDRIAVLDSAYQAAQESYAFRHTRKAFDLLWSLCNDYWSALSKGESDVTARQCFGSAYAAKESETISKAGRKRRTFTFDGADIEMERHLKIGVADNKAETLRIHFEWLADRRMIVVGHCGAHLNF